MSFKLKSPISSAWLANKLNIPANGHPRTILGVTSLQKPETNFLTFTKKTEFPHEDMIVIGPPQLRSPSNFLISCLNPRLEFIRSLNFLENEIGFSADESPPKIHPSVSIGQHVVIGTGVEIGEGTVIGHHVVIASGVKIGKYCRIKSNCVIGEEGYGFERDETGLPIRMPHLGSVSIGDHAEIGSFTTVCKGTLSSTIIENGVKIDDHCHIAHNCHIRENAMIVAGAIVGGSTIVGQECWVAPNASLLNKITLHPKAFVGLGAVVLKDVQEGTTVAGNPARPLIKQSTLNKGDSKGW